MINWWLVVFLSLTGFSWVRALAEKPRGKFEIVGRVSAILFVAGLMYMSGIFTEL